MSEELLVRHCAPTLAGLKTGNMFSCAYRSREDVVKNVRALNKKLVKKGICVLPLRYLKDRVLIYVYRPAKLGRDLGSAETRRMLSSMGYSCKSPNDCLRELMDRLRTGEDFPHEVGLFLGYPPEDVAGFIQNAAGGYKCVGCWKVYGDEARAREIFETYKKCSRIYYDEWRRGKSIERLAVAV